MQFSNSQIFTDDLPKIDAVDLKPISKQYLKIIAFNKLILFGILFSALFALKQLIEEDGFQDNFQYVILFAIGFCILNLIVSLLAFKKRKYAIRENDVIYAKGLIINYLTTVPIIRIQHVEVSRSWLERRLALASLKIYSAGESGSDMKISGLSVGEAKQINDFISAKING